MGFKDWLTKNIYVTAPSDPDPFFHPRRYAQPKAEVLRAVEETISGLPGWKRLEYRENQGRFRVERARFLRFPDDINIYVVQGADGVTLLEMTSQAKTGKGDWGRNRRNLRAFLSGLDRRFPSAS